MLRYTSGLPFVCAGGYSLREETLEIERKKRILAGRDKDYMVDFNYFCPR